MWPTLIPDETPSNSRANCVHLPSGNHEAPSHINFAGGQIRGNTDCNAATFSSKRWSLPLAAAAFANFSRTFRKDNPRFPIASVSGLRKISPFRSADVLCRTGQQRSHALPNPRGPFHSGSRVRLWACRQTQRTVCDGWCVPGKWRLWSRLWFHHCSFQGTATAAGLDRHETRAGWRKR